MSALKTSIDAGELDALPANQPPTYILFNYGVNDIDSELTTQELFEANYGYCLDWFHAKWPTSRMYLMRPWWRRVDQTPINTLCDTWIPNILATRSNFAFAGPDERIFLENGDDGTTLTADGTHPNAAGYDATASAWKAAIGL